MTDYTTQRVPGSDRICVRLTNGEAGFVVKTYRRNAYRGRKTHGWNVFGTGTHADTFVGTWDDAVGVIRNGRHRTA